MHRVAGIFARAHIRVVAFFTATPSAPLRRAPPAPARGRLPVSVFFSACRVSPRPSRRCWCLHHVWRVAALTPGCRTRLTGARRRRRAASTGPRRVLRETDNYYPYYYQTV
ncbi:hypothetical protein EVAR_24992_1 [Eumeta japonica]|uniref:Uncharacterized protein n=1 Tax=Eumeta variegata TaxID=151549 RepID=A0A4C1XKT1_EUMVA|nr:hypothetical protein EVAR_24992_1 [Eumeta japonica]